MNNKAIKGTSIKPNLDFVLVGIVLVDTAVVGIFLAALNGALLELELDTYTKEIYEMEIHNIVIGGGKYFLSGSAFM